MPEFILFLLITVNGGAYTVQESFYTEESCHRAAEAISSKFDSYTAMQIKTVCVKR
jgi:hypothetical protein